MLTRLGKQFALSVEPYSQRTTLNKIFHTPLFFPRFIRLWKKIYEVMMSDQGERIQGWIKTLWPMAVVIIGLFFFIKDMQRDNDITNAVQDQRLEVIEECQQEMSDAIDELSAAQGITNASIATLNTNVTSILRILERNYGE